MQKLMVRSRYSRSLLIGVSFLVVHILATRFANFSDGPTICPVRIFFGFPCPMCGTTRALGALSRGEFVTSLRYNPMGAIGSFTMILWALSPIKFSTYAGRLHNSVLSKPRFQILVVIVFVYVLLWTLDWLRVRNHFYIG